jgi:hypothetical protein
MKGKGMGGIPPPGMLYMVSGPCSYGHCIPRAQKPLSIEEKRDQRWEAGRLLGFLCGMRPTMIVEARLLSSYVAIHTVSKRSPTSSPFPSVRVEPHHSLISRYSSCGSRSLIGIVQPRNLVPTGSRIRHLYIARIRQSSLLCR